MWLKHELKVTKREVKRQIIAGLDDSELMNFKFSKSDAGICLKWKHSKEFEFNAEMYDVVKSIVKGDTIIYTCWWDNNETKLNKQLAHLMDDIIGSNRQNKENQKRLVSFYQKLFHENTLNIFGIHTINTTNLYCSFNNIIYSLSATAPPVPPPEKV